MQLYLKHKNDLETAGVNLTLMQVFKFNDMEQGWCKWKVKAKEKWRFVPSPFQKESA